MKSLEFVLRYLYFFLGKIVSRASWLFYFLVTRDRRNQNNANNLVIVPIGEPAATSNFRIELEKYGKEMFGDDIFKVLVVRRDLGIHTQIKSAIQGEYKGAKHLFLDVRTLPSSGLAILKECLFITWITQGLKIIPICYLTDATVIRQRLASIFITAQTGQILSILPKHTIEEKIPHQRLEGSALMPISVDSCQSLYPRSVNNKVLEEYQVPVSKFVGSLYPERNSILERAQSLKDLIDLEIIEKSPRIASQEYWELLSRSHVSLVTTKQTNIERNWSDLGENPHLVWRISEVFAARSLLLVEDVPELHEYFQDNEHFVSFTNTETLISKLQLLNMNKHLIYRIALSGHKRFVDLQKQGDFWRRAFGNEFRRCGGKW